MMKAFMSHGERQEWNLLRNTFAATYEDAALAEARAILAESEPRGWDAVTKVYTWDWRPVIECGHVDSDVPLALAESLRAFIDAPIRCAVCGEESAATGSLAGLVHKYGPVSHGTFEPSL